MEGRKVFFFVFWVEGGEGRGGGGGNYPPNPNPLLDTGVGGSMVLKQFFVHHAVLNRFFINLDLLVTFPSFPTFLIRQNLQMNFPNFPPGSDETCQILNQFI